MSGSAADGTVYRSLAKDISGTLRTKLIKTILADQALEYYCAFFTAIGDLGLSRGSIGVFRAFIQKNVA